MEEKDAPLESTSTTLSGTALQCPKCPVVTDTLTRHLRLVHSIRDAPKRVKKKGKCHLCFKEVSVFPAHVKGYHKICNRSALYTHLIQLSRYGFNESTQSSPESGTESDVGEAEEERQLLEKFKAHLESLDGGLRAEDTAIQHTRQIRQIIADHGFEIFQDIGPLMETGGFLHKNWKEPEVTGRREWRVGTVKSYLYSIRLFLNFCLISRECVPQESCNNGLQRITRWLASLNKEAKVRSQDLHIEEASKLLTADEIASFYQSESHQQALSHFENLKKSGDAIDIDYATLTALRNDLILWLLLDNGPRSGSILNATVEEFEGATTETGDDWVISIRDHKTYASYGPCYIVLSKCLYECLKTWVHVIRPVLVDKLAPEEREPNIFVHYNGKVLNKTNSMRQLKGYVEEALGVSDVTATRIRKSLVALLNEDSDSGTSMADVATHFSHSAQTQSTHYNIKKKMHTALKVSSKIKELTQTKVSSVHHTTEPKEGVEKQMAESRTSVAGTSSHYQQPGHCLISSATSECNLPETGQNNSVIINQATVSPARSCIQVPAGTEAGTSTKSCPTQLLPLFHGSLSEGDSCNSNDRDDNPSVQQLKDSYPSPQAETKDLAAKPKQTSDSLQPTTEETKEIQWMQYASDLSTTVPSESGRRLWNLETSQLLLTALNDYLQLCLKSGLLPKVVEVSRILQSQNLQWIMAENGRQRTMEKVRLELKNMKKGTN